MRLVADNSGAVECSGGESSIAAAGADGSGGAVVVVAVKLDTRSKELLTWALVKVAQSGDRVIALHILDPDADKASLISLVKTFDSILAAYEGFCNLKQVDLKLKVCKGSPVRKIILREAKLCGSTCLILGASDVHHRMRSKISVAKYCAKNLQKNISVICVDNGKIVFQRESDVPSASLQGYVSQPRPKRRKTLSKSPLSLPPQILLTSSGCENENMSMALVPVKSQEMPESKSRWSILRGMFFQGRRLPETSSPKKSSMVQWIFRSPSRQSVSAIFPDQKQITATDRGECHLDLDSEKGAIVLYSADNFAVPYSSNGFSEELKALGEKYSTMCRLFSYQELLLATNNFIPENLIGKGGSSQVYRGCLPGGEELAVKILKTTEDVLKHFVSEIEIIMSLHHKNIISLVGFCFEDDRLLLVYNLLSRGSLEDNLHGAEKSQNIIGWDERYKVALGVAEALDHLHSIAEPIIHRDIKSSNILLSDNFEPQLSDFGLATWASSCLHHMGTSDVAGTFGLVYNQTSISSYLQITEQKLFYCSYLAPEYFMNGKLNDKIDIYAFGVVLLELLSSRKPIDNGFPKGKESLVMWAKHILKEGKISELQDPKLVNDYNHEQFEIMVLAATLCIRHAPQSRPEMSLVLKLLQGDPAIVKWARQETKTCEGFNVINSEQSTTDIQSFINLALLNLEDDSASTNSTDLNISVEDYLGGRWSRSSSFD